jgi:hypothetical protein
LDCGNLMRSRSPQTVLNPSDCGDARQSAAIDGTPFGFLRRMAAARKFLISVVTRYTK